MEDRPQRPHTDTSPTPPRPRTSQRPRTGASRAPRPPTARPDTSASGISADELPDQKFFPEDDGFDEEEEEMYEEDEPDEEGVFAFARPQTRAVPNANFSGSEYDTSAPGTGVSTFTSNPPLTSESRNTGHNSGGPSNGLKTPSDLGSGNVDAGGRIPELEYDSSNPPIFSGKNNLNNSAFAFSVSSHGSRKPSSQGKQSLFGRLARRPIGTASTDMTGSTGITGTTEASRSRTSFGSDDTGGLSTDGGQKQPRRMRSGAPLIPSTAGSGYSSSDGTTSRGFSRGSYGMTEMTGDMTIPDGKTTWGDGSGGAMKDISEQGEDIPAMSSDFGDEDSPYPEVRASVSNLDDVDMPSLTFRAWFLGLLFAIVGSAINTFFHFRNPSPYISPLIVQVIAYPAGKFAAWCLPIRTFHNPRWLGGSEWSFNPGPFNIKEHAIITMMSSVAIGPAYGLWVVVSSELYYMRPFGVGFNIMFLFTTQVTGFAFAGLCRRFVVWPASMIWPGVLVISTNLNTLHAEEEGFQGSMTRFRFLLYTGAGAFAWYFLPGYLFTSLSYFSWICWIRPDNPTVNNLFGVNTGLGMGILTFDWSQIAWIGSPLVIPWWAIVNVGIGFVLCYWIIVPILYFTNVWEFAYMPISAIQIIDRFSSPFNVGNIINFDDFTLNTTAYAEYSPPYLSAAFSMTFMLAFALTSALVVHTALHHGPRIYRAIINVKTEADDVHSKLMKHYPEVPDWWFGVLLAVFGIVFGIVSIQVYQTGLPVWGYFLSILIPAVYILPAAFIFAMTNQLIAINLIAELIPGYLFPGQPIPCMLFKCFSMQTVSEALTFTQNMKLGHYMKVPPRHTFVAQTTAMLVSCLVQIGTKNLLFAVVHDMCASNQKDLMTCNSTKVFFTSSIIWGLIGPGRLFSKGAMYAPQVWACAVGAILPIPLWWWVRRHPRSIFRNVNLPVLFNGPLGIPPATGINYASWLVTGFVFQFWLRRRRFAWWSKYNYVLSAALDVGTALSGLAIFLFLRLPGVDLQWWGTQVYLNTGDWVGLPYLTADENGFGPTTWNS